MSNVYVFAIHSSLFAIRTKSQNQDFRSPIIDVRIYRHPKIIVLDPKWVHMARHGLKLCQDGATGSNIIFIYLPGPKTDLKNYNFEFSWIWVGGMGRSLLNPPRCEGFTAAGRVGSLCLQSLPPAHPLYNFLHTSCEAVAKATS